MQSRQEDQCRKLHDKVEGLSERNRGLMLENETLQRQVLTMWMCLFTLCHFAFPNPTGLK